MAGAFALAPVVGLVAAAEYYEAMLLITDFFGAGANAFPLAGAATLVPPRI